MTDPFALTSLEGERVALRALSIEHVDELARAGAEDRATYGFTVVPGTPAETRDYVEDLLRLRARRETMPFAQIDLANGRAVGVTRYLNFRTRLEGDVPYAVEIGGTWLAASSQRSPLNSNAKLLLLDQAFSTWGCARVDLKTDARNLRSRAAIERLGADFEGVLRKWQPSQLVGEEHAYRDTAMYAITSTEWSRVREGLVNKLASY